MRVNPLAELSPHGWSTATRSTELQRAVDGRRPARPTCWPSRWTSCAPARSTRTPEEPALLGDVVLCPEVAATQARAGRATAALDELAPADRRTGSCTCSATTTPSPTRTGRCSRLQDAAPRRLACPARRSPRSRAPATARDRRRRCRSLAAAVLVVAAGVLSAVDAALAQFSRARAEELVGEGRTRRRGCSPLRRRPAPLPQPALLLRLARRDHRDRAGDPRAGQALDRTLAA